MKRVHYHMLYALALPLSFMVAATGTAQDPKAGSLVDVGTFTVNVPDLDDWEVKIDKEKSLAEFSQSKQELLSLLSSGAGGQTSITVFRNRPEGGTPGLWMMTEAEMATHYRRLEYDQLFNIPGVRVTSADTDAVEFEGKKYYRLLYKTRFAQKYVGESILYLHFPPEFSRTREFYGFLIAESYVGGSIFAAKNLDQIKPLIRSLRTEGSTSTVPGIGGDLIRAAAAGDTAKVRNLVEGGANVNAQPPDGRGPLAIAALFGHESIVRYLVDRGASVNPETAQEIHTPLSSAILGREVKIAAFLLERGARAAGRPTDPMTPLSRSLTKHLDTSFVSTLLAHGAVVNQCNVWTPLMHAANEGLTPAAVQLIDHGATLDYPTTEGETALMVALTSEHPEVAALLLERGAGVNVSSNDGTTPLICAAQANDTTSLVRLLEKGAKVDNCTKEGESALSGAAGAGHAECVRILLTRGATVDLPTDRGVTPLCFSVFDGHVECAKLLLDKGADINHQTTTGWTPLMFAAYKGQETAVRLLIDRGAKLDLENKNGDTALDIADDRDLDAIEAMLEEAEKKAGM